MCAYSGLKGKKRRQVVPFDYWIRGGSPRSAPKGDFGHSAPTYVRPGHCRYYAMGHCVHGMRCKYKHEQSGEPMSPPQWSTPPLPLPPPLPAYSPVAYPVTPPASCAVPLFDTMMTPPQMMTPASSISSMGSLTYSPSTATTVSEDMPWISEFDQHDDAGVAIASPVDEFGVRMPAPQPASKVRNMKYKTSPCMFFRSASGCSRGDMCTFIHSEPSPVSTPEPSALALPPKPAPPPPQESQEERKREFYPIKWRVISGGTKLGRTTPPLERAARPRKASTRQRIRPRLPTSLMVRPPPPPCVPFQLQAPPQSQAPVGLLPAWTAAPVPSPSPRSPVWSESPSSQEEQDLDVFSSSFDFPLRSACTDDGAPPCSYAFPTRPETPPSIPRRLSLPETPARARALSSPYAVSPRVTRRRVERLHLFSAESP